MAVKVSSDYSRCQGCVAVRGVTTRILTLFLTGDWKVPRTRRLESLRYVARTFLSAVLATFQSPDAPSRDFPAKNSVKMHPYRPGGAVTV